MTSAVVMTWVIAEKNGVVTVPNVIFPGGIAIFVGDVVAPTAPGISTCSCSTNVFLVCFAGPYIMAYQLRRGSDPRQDFDNFGNPAWFANILVQ